MHKMRLFLLVGLLLAPAAAQVGPGRPVSAIQPGEPAPALQIASWVKGEPIDRFEPGKVYLVEFWAVWCGPCIANIPHLNALQKRIGRDGLVVIGMTSPDRVAGYTGPRKEGNSLEMVQDFVRARGSGMDYHVAYDQADRATFKAFMGQRSGIPHAFLFDRAGRMVVDFHPTFLDDAVAQVIAGTWDPVNGLARMNAAHRQFLVALNATTYATFRKYYDELRNGYPGAAARLAPNYFRHALKAGDLAGLRDAAGELGHQAVELEDARTISSAAMIAARELVTLRKSHVGGFVPAASLAEVRAVLEGMVATATRLASGTEPTVFTAQAELAWLDGRAVDAIALQEKAVGQLLPGAKGGDEVRQRLEEMKQSVAAARRKAEIMRANGYID